MNEYTRREEVRWTLVASLALVLGMAPAVFLLVTAQGALVPDPGAQLAAKVVTVERWAARCGWLSAMSSVQLLRNPAGEEDGDGCPGPGG